MGTYVQLFLAIICETMGTSFLKQSEGYTKFWPSAVTLAGYALSFYFLSLVLKSMPVSLAMQSGSVLASCLSA